jgi:outer membrane protein assembly factor BamE (lipoprotein component of BamABCDE complex)
MKTYVRYFPVVAVALALIACSSAVTPDKLQQISDGMKPDQVTTLLGQPTRIDHAEITGLTGDVYHYVSSKGDGRVVFVNGAVFETAFDANRGHA